MKKNVGSFDGTARFLLGWGVLFMGNHGYGWWSLLGLLPILTAVFEFCPLYCILHLNTAAWEEAYEARHHHDPPGKY